MNSRSLRLMAANLEQAAAVLRSLADQQDAADTAIASASSETLHDALMKMRSEATGLDKSRLTKILKAVHRLGVKTWEELATVPMSEYKDLRNYGEALHTSLCKLCEQRGVAIGKWD